MACFEDGLARMAALPASCRGGPMRLPFPAASGGRTRPPPWTVSIWSSAQVLAWDLLPCPTP